MRKKLTVGAFLPLSISLIIAGIFDQRPTACEPLSDSTLNLTAIFEYRGPAVGYRHWKLYLPGNGKAKQTFYEDTGDGVSLPKRCFFRQFSWQDMQALRTVIQRQHFFQLSDQYIAQENHYNARTLQIRVGNSIHTTSIHGAFQSRDWPAKKRFLIIWLELIKRVPNPNFTPDTADWLLERIQRGPSPDDDP